MEPDTNLNAGNGMGTGGTSQNAAEDTSTFFNVDGKAAASTPSVEAVPEKAPEEVKPKAISLESIAPAAPETLMAEKELAPKPAVEATSFTNLQKGTGQPQAEVPVKNPAQLSSDFYATDLSLTELTSPPENQPMSHLKIALIVGGVLLVLGGVAAAIYFSSSSNLKGDITAVPQTCAIDTYAPKAGTSATTSTGNNFGADLTALRAPAAAPIDNQAIGSPQNVANVSNLGIAPNYTNVYYPSPAPISNQGAAVVSNNSQIISNNAAANQVTNAGTPSISNTPAAAVSNQIPILREAPAANSSVLNNVAPVGNNAVGGSPSATIVGSPAMTVGGTPPSSAAAGSPNLTVGGTPPSSAAVGSPNLTVGGPTSSATTPNAPVCSRINPNDCALISELYTNQDKYILNTQTISHLKTWNDACNATTSSTTPTTTPTTGGGTTTTSSTTTTTSSTTPNTNLTTGGGTTSTTVGVTPPTTATGGSTLTTGGTVSTSTSNTRTTTTTTTTPTTLNSCQQQDKDIQDAYRNQQWQAVYKGISDKIADQSCRIASGSDRLKQQLLFDLILSTDQKMTSLRPALSREIADLRNTLIRDGNIIPPTSSTACTDSQRNPQPITTSLETVLGNPDQVTTSSGSGTSTGTTTGSLPNIDLTTVSDGQLMGGFSICAQITKTAISPAATEAPKKTDAPPATQTEITAIEIKIPPTGNKDVPYSGLGSLPKNPPLSDGGLGSGSDSISAPVAPPIEPKQINVPLPPAEQVGAGAQVPPAAPVFAPLQAESLANVNGFASSASAPVAVGVLNQAISETVSVNITTPAATTGTTKTTTTVLHGAASSEPLPLEITQTGPESYYLLLTLPIVFFLRRKAGKAGKA